MNSVVKIIKRGEREQKNLETGPNEGTGQQARREIVRTVKGWISELHQRRRDEQLRSLEQWLTLPPATAGYEAGIHR